MRRIFYSFTAYDKVRKKRVKCNFNTLTSARTYRNELLIDKNYSQISEIFEDSLEIKPYRFIKEYGR